MKFILGKKIGMTQVFEEDGKVVPVTVVEIEPNVVVQVRTKDKDGYEAVQIGTGTKKPKNINKPQKGHFKDLGTFRDVKEFRGSQELKEGDKFDASVFAIGDKVRVTGISKGKGFAGVMKRHNFSGMPHSHGHHHVARHAGSIGQRFPQHTLKGMRMAGRTGHDQVTTRGLKIIRVDVEGGLIAVKGAVPGNRGQLLMIQEQ